MRSEILPWAIHLVMCFRQSPLPAEQQCNAVSPRDYSTYWKYRIHLYAQWYIHTSMITVCRVCAYSDELFNVEFELSIIEVAGTFQKL